MQRIPLKTNKLYFAVLLLLVQMPLSSLLINPDAPQRVLQGNPSNYRELLKNLRPGDMLLLEAGTYTEGLWIHDLNGEPDKPIVIAGPEKAPRAIFLGRGEHNTVDILRASYIKILNLELDGQGVPVDAVKAGGHTNWAHHITLENLYIHGHGANQQIVGISTKCPTWDWVIRNNVIIGAGTGLYLGNSNGDDPFVGGLIENNLIGDTLGYNMQIKHQNPRPNIPGMPAGDHTTLIRHNVFSKANNGSLDRMARPNVLVGHFPLSGPGVHDVYQIYGNFFYQNPTGEPLFQGEGNIALYNNVFVNNNGSAIWIQPHNDVPRTIHIFFNTIVASGTGIKVIGGASAYQQKVVGNAVFASIPIQAADQQDNIKDSFQAAGNYLTHPTGNLGELDLFPRPGRLVGPPIDPGPLRAFLDWDRDFNGQLRDPVFRGAYTQEGQNPGWLPKLERKPSK